ncbi:MAG: toast rack family protein [Anaerolineales bacterium]
MNRNRKIVMGLVAGLLLTLSLGCRVTMSFDSVEVGELQYASKRVELEDAGEVRVDVRFSAGELRIAGGTEPGTLLDADFTYNVENWEPLVEYNGERLVVRQPSSQKIPVGDRVRYEWDLLLNEGVPLDLRIDFGAGQANLDLSALSLTDFDLTMGAGDVDIDLEGNRTLEQLELDMAAGDMTVDLRGDWEHDVDVTIQGGVGQMTLRLPEDQGVRVEVSKGLGNVDAGGFNRDGNTYTNDAYADSETTLYVIIQAGMGQINLDLD